MGKAGKRPALVMGVGASAGGLDAFKQLLSVLPDDSGVAFLLVQHLDPTHKSMLTELLSSHTNMTVTEADQNLELEPDTVYIIRPDTALGVRNNKIELTEPTLDHRVRFTATPAEDRGDDAVVLTFEEVDDETQSPRATDEALETCNEELRSSSEEATSMNEELQSAYERLDKKNRRLDLAWEAARGGIYEHRVPLDETTFHSDHWARMLGYRQDEIPGHERFLDWLHERVHPDDREAFDRAHTDFIEGETEHYKVELRLRHRSGRWIWVRGIARALERDEYGKVTHLIGMMIDITDLKQTEEALRESEQRFREMADGLPLLVWVHDAEGKQEVVNETFCEFFGVDREEMIGSRWQGLLHPNDAEAYTAAFQEAVESRQPFQAQVRVKRADGQWRWLESTGQPRLGSCGEFLGFVGTSADITARKEAEEALRESEQWFRTLADNISQLAWMAEGDGRIFWYNERWFNYTGTTMDEVEGWGWTALPRPDHVDRVVDKISRCFRTGEHWEDIFPLRGADGEYRWFLSRAVPILDGDGQVIRWFGTHTDVTEQRRAEQRLREVDERKDEFLAMLGHELRNPLAAIQTAAELVKRSHSGNDRLDRAYGVLHRQSAHMSRLIDGLLEVSRINRGKISIDHAPVDLVELLEALLQDHSAQADPEAPELAPELPSEPIYVLGDAVRLTQILSNLIDNALKFTSPTGRVDLSLEQRDGEAVIAVRDDGIGIRPEIISRIFDPFLQDASDDMARERGGLGLGLALVKRLVELHEGTIEAHSDGLGRGAEFLIKLPLVRSQPSLSTPDEGSEISPLRVLVIEDNEDAALSLQDLLELQGHQASVANDGATALDLLQQNGVDVVLCDIGLPGMNGYDLAQTIRADADLSSVALCALTGYGKEEDRHKAIEAGFDEHLTKPVDLDLLEQMISRLARSRS